MTKGREGDKTMLLDDRSPPGRCSASTSQLGLKVFMCFILVWVVGGVLLADIVTPSMPMPFDLCVEVGAGAVLGLVGLWLTVVIKQKKQRTSCSRVWGRKK
jgi:hypothetical protein